MEPIVCFTCGKDISTRYEAYLALKELLKDDEEPSTNEEFMNAKSKDIFYILCFDKKNYHCTTNLSTVHSIEKHTVDNQ